METPVTPAETVMPDPMGGPAYRASLVARAPADYPGRTETQEIRETPDHQ